MEKLKIGFFGGSFNPPSNIHIKLASDLIQNGKLDKVIFVPVGDFYEKKELLEFKHRSTMLKFAIEGKNNLIVENIEENFKEKMYAIDIFRIISEKYKENDLYFIMGSDNYSKIEEWKEYEELKKYKYIILERNEEDISSTEIRKMIKNNKLIPNIIDDKVYEYIKTNKLYK